MANDQLINAREAKGLSRRALVVEVNRILHGESWASARSAFNGNYLGKLERGDITRPGVVEYRAALRTALDKGTDEELGFSGNIPGAVTGPRCDCRTGGLHPAGFPAELDKSIPASETDPVHRRAVLALLLRLASGEAANRADVAQLVAGSSLAGSEGSLASHWESVAWEYGCTYLTSSRQQTMRDLSMDLATLELAIPRMAEGPGSRTLHSAGARLAALLAMACTDLGYGREARHSWFMARRLSDASANPDINLWVRGQEALLGIYSGRPLAALERLTTDSLDLDTDLRGQGAADLLAARAQTFALQGRASEALNTLKDLKSTFEELPDSVVTDVDSLYSWPEHRLHHTVSFVSSIVGSTQEAARAQEDALRLYPASRFVSRCQVELHRSVALVRSGDIQPGISHATSELEKLPAGRRGKFVLTVANCISATIPSASANLSKVQTFRSFLADLNS